MSGPEGSSIKQLSGCAAGLPGSSHLTEKRPWSAFIEGRVRGFFIVKKSPLRDFFEFYGFCLWHCCHRAAKPAGYENLRFSSVLTHMSSEPE